MENVMAKEKTAETNAEKTEESEAPFQYVVDIIQGVFDTTTALFLTRPVHSRL